VGELANGSEAHIRLIDVNYFRRLATTILAGPDSGRGCDDPAAG
jgi:hypothetical protein